MFSLRLWQFGRLNFLALAGHVLALVAVAGLLLVPGVWPAVAVTAVLGLAYTALTWRTRESIHLYPASLFLTASYLLVVGQVAWLDALFLWALPFQVSLFALGWLLRRRVAAAFGVPLGGA